MKENHRLIKCSSPGWSKEFASEGAARRELLAHICASCLEGIEEVISPVDGQTRVRLERNPPDQSDIRSLLGTSCGVEFEYDDGT